MNEGDWLAKRFEEVRPHLQAVAYRMLGTRGEADDAVQEAWLRLVRSDAGAIENLGGWLTTVVARVCLDLLRARKARREASLADAPAETIEPPGQRRDPETDVALADAIGPALLIVLETLAPAERVAFVLHDLFDLSFDEVAPIVGRTPEATRQLASRARRRVRGAAAPESDSGRQRELVAAFLAASRGGDLDALMAVLAPDVVLRADEVAVRTAAARQAQGAPRLASEMRGAAAVADAFKGRARAAVPAHIDGEPGAAWVVGAQVRVAWLFQVEHGRITAIEVAMDPARLAKLDIESAA